MIEKVKAKVIEKLKNDSHRLNHVLGVYQTSLELAKVYQCDQNFVGIASLYHDYTKNDSIEAQKAILTKEEFAKYESYPVMYHALSAARHLENDFKIKNIEILNAIKSHIWGRPYMSIYEKIVFVADYCEPNRTFFDTKEIYDLAVKDIDLAVLACIELTLNYLKKEGVTPSIEQLEAHTYYMEVNSGKTK